MRFLLLCHTHVTPGSFFQDYLAGIAQAARESGHDTISFEYDRIGEASAAERDALYRLVLNQDIDAVIDPCCWGYALSEGRVWDGSGQGEALFDSIDAAYIGLLCDQPYYQPLQGIISNRLYAAVPDLTHPAQIALTLPQLQLRSTCFAPPAARVENDRSAPWSQREIDLLYVGNLKRDALDRPWRRSPEAPHCDQLADRALASPDVPLHEVMLDMVREEQLVATPADMMLWLQRVEYFLRARLRQHAVHSAAASGLRMTIVGEGWEPQRSHDWPSTVTIRPPLSYEEFFVLAGRSKMALDASTYLNGANDRIFNLLVNRCLPVTNARGWLENEFAEQGMRFYSMKRLEDLGDLLQQSLSTRLADEMDAARSGALQRHTWRQRLGTILDMIRAPT
jgi:hypothetical protein